MRWAGCIVGVGLLLVCALPSSAADPKPHQAVWDQVKALHKLLKRTSSRNDELIAGIAGLERAYRALPDENTLDDATARKQLDKLKDAVEKVWLRALTTARIPPRSKQNLRAPVQIRAAAAIAGARPCIDPRFRKALDKQVIENDRYVVVPRLYEASFSALVALGQPKLVAWLLKHGVVSNVNLDDKQRTLAAIEALLSMRDMPGAERREVVRRILAIFQSYPFHWVNEYEAVGGFRGAKQHLKKVAGTATPYWTDIRPTILRALRTFSIDPRTGRPPFEKRTGREIEALPRFLNWFATNQRVAAPPWLDAEADETLDRYVPPTIPLLFHRFGTRWEVRWGLLRNPAQPRAKASSLDEDDGAAVLAVRQALRPRLHEALATWLDDKSPHVRAAAAVGLALADAPKAAERLDKLLDADRAPRVREAAALAMMRLHPADRLAWFQARVRDAGEHITVRAYATLALGWLKDTPFLWEVVRADDAPSWGTPDIRADLRACAVFALGLSREAGSAEPLRKRLVSRSEPPAVLGAIGPALAMLGETSVVPDLLTFLAVRKKYDHRNVAQVSAALALGHLIAPDDRRSIERVAKRLATNKGQFGGVRAALARALGQIGGSEARAQLEEAYEDCLKDTMRFGERGHFLLAFGLDGSSGARHRLRRQLESLTHDRDLGAAAAAAALAGDTSAPARVRAHIDGGPNGVPYVLTALGRTGHVSAAEQVRDVLLRRRDPRVVREGALALGRLLGPAALPDLRRSWARSHARASFDMIAWAAYHAPSDDTFAWLQGIANDAARRPYERACAILGLARMAGTKRLDEIRVFGHAFNPFGEAATLSGLALRGDAAFLD